MITPDLDSWREATETLRKNWPRTAMTAWGIFWGTLMLVIMLGLGNAFTYSVSRNMVDFATRSIYIWGQFTSRPYAGLPPGRRLRFDVDDTSVIRRSVAGVAALAPRVQLGEWDDTTHVHHGNQTASAHVVGDHPELARVVPGALQRGRFLNVLDLRERRKVAVLGARVCRVLFGTQRDPLGQYVSIRGVHFRVIGVVQSEFGGEQGEHEDDSVHVPFTTFQATFNVPREVGWFTVLVAPGSDPQQVEGELRRVLARQHMVDPDDTQALGSYNGAEGFEQVRRLFAGVRFLVWLVCSITLLAAALGVSSILLVSVQERTREFALRKALGARSRALFALVLKESTLLSAGAGGAGLLVGLIALEVGAGLLGDALPSAVLRLDPSAGCIAIGLLLLAGCLAGFVPARRAARLEPAHALRVE
jgi:putative ABC transport system permease protein